MPKRPDPEVQRAILTQMRDNHRNKGFACEVDIATLEVQTGIGDDSIQGERAKLENLAENSFASADLIDEMLKKLPKPSPNPATRTKQRT